MLIRRKNLKAAVPLLALILSAVISVSAQSSDQDLPTPVRSYEINGAIAALDMGDPRLTRHFYAFNGTHGDLLITVESKNLNGDVDVFTAGTFKPLVKIPMYAQSSSPTTKSIYIRAEEILILRVEARSPNDDQGQYRVRFGGAFSAFSGGIPVQEEQVATALEPIRISSGRNTRRVSSVGARVDEPSVTPTPQPTPVTETTADAPKTEGPTTGTEVSRPSRKSSTTNRTTTGRAPRERKPAKAKTPPDTSTNESDKSASSESTSPKTDAASETGEKPSDTKPVAADPEKKPAEEPKQEIVPPTPVPGAHLIIEEKDGTRVDRPMSTIKRVLVDNGLINVFLKNGKIERFALADVARMTIEQQ